MPKLTCLLNGLIDVPLNDLQGLTPLEKAQTPILDQLMSAGDQQNLRAPERGGWESALLSYLGVNDAADELSSGPIEALAIGRQLAAHEIAYSLRFVSAGENTIVDVGDNILNDSECRVFCALLTQEFKPNYGLEFWPLSGPRALLIGPRTPQLPEAEAPDAVDPVGCSWPSLIPDDSLRCALLGASECLLQHPVNELRIDLEEDPVAAFLLFGAGTRQKWARPSGKAPLLYTPHLASQGVGRAVGAELLQLPSEHRRFSHVEQLLKRLPELVNNYDEIVIDIPYLWQSTYKGDLLEKIKTMEWLDSHWLEPLHALCHQNEVGLEIAVLRPCDIRTGRWVAGDGLKISCPVSQSV